MNETLLPLTIRIWRDNSTKDRPYLAYSPDFRVVVAGKDATLAKNSLLNIVEDIVTQEEEEGNLDIFLEQIGFSQNKKTSRWEAPEFSFVQVPLKVGYA